RHLRSLESRSAGRDLVLPGGEADKAIYARGVRGGGLGNLCVGVHQLHRGIRDHSARTVLHIALHAGVELRKCLHGQEEEPYRQCLNNSTIHTMRSKASNFPPTVAKTFF